MNAAIDIDAPWERFLRELRERIGAVSRDLAAISEGDASVRPTPKTWSKKELVGHLIDSASNNHQRFVRAAFQDTLVFAGYDQDAWVAAQRYQDAPWAELVLLWSAYNLQLVRVAAALPLELRSRVTTRHNFERIAWRSVAAGAPVTLEWFVRDYAGHLEHHLAQVLRR